MTEAAAITRAASRSDRGRPPIDLDLYATWTVDRDRVLAVCGAMPARRDIDGLARVFVLLGEPGGLRLLTSLVQAGEWCACDLAAVAKMSESAVSHALRLLRAARIVSVRRRGRTAYYRLDDAHVQMLLDMGLAHTCHADADATQHGAMELDAHLAGPTG